MRAALLSLLLLASPAFAAEKLLGSIVSAAGADTTNASTASPFVVPFAAKLTIQCNAAAYLSLSTSTAASSTTSVTVASGEKFPTSSESQSSSPVLSISGKSSAVVRIAGAGAVTCLVFQRKGDE
jgi:hypothetical protein